MTSTFESANPLHGCWAFKNAFSAAANVSISCLASSGGVPSTSARRTGGASTVTSSAITRTITTLLPKSRARCRWFVFTDSELLWYKFRDPDVLSTLPIPAHIPPSLLCFGGKLLGSLPLTQIRAVVYGPPAVLGLRNVDLPEAARNCNACDIILLLNSATPTASNSMKAFRMLCLNAADAQACVHALQIAGVHTVHDSCMNATVYRSLQQEGVPTAVWSPQSVVIHLPFGIGSVTVTPGVMTHVLPTMPSTFTARTDGNFAYVSVFPPESLLPQQVSGVGAGAKSFWIEAKGGSSIISQVLSNDGKSLSYSGVSAGDVIRMAVLALQEALQVTDAPPTHNCGVSAYAVPALRVDMALNTLPTDSLRVLREFATNVSEGDYTLCRLPHVVLRSDSGLPIDGASVTMNVSPPLTPGAPSPGVASPATRKRGIGRRATAMGLYFSAGKKTIQEYVDLSSKYPLSIHLASLAADAHVVGIEACWDAAAVTMINSTAEDIHAIAVDGPTTDRVLLALRQLTFTLPMGSRKCVGCRMQPSIPYPHTHLTLLPTQAIPSALARVPEARIIADCYGEARRATVVRVFAGDLAWEVMRRESAWSNLFAWSSTFWKTRSNTSVSLQSALLQGVRGITSALHPWNPSVEHNTTLHTAVLAAPEMGVVYRTSHGLLPWGPSPTFRNSNSISTSTPAGEQAGSPLRKLQRRSSSPPASPPRHAAANLSAGYNAMQPAARGSGFAPGPLDVDDVDDSAPLVSTSPLHSGRIHVRSDEESRVVLERHTTIVSWDEYLEVRRRKWERWLEQFVSYATASNQAPLLEWLGCLSTPTAHTSDKLGTAKAAIAEPEKERRMIPIAKVAEFVRPGDILLFKCANTASAVQRMFSACEYDHVAIVVDAAWAEASLPSRSPTMSPLPSKQLQRASSVSKFFGKDLVQVSAEHDDGVASVSTNTSHPASLTTAWSEHVTEVSGLEDVTTKSTFIPLSHIPPKPMWVDTDAGAAMRSHVPTAADLGRHTYNLQLLEATVDGVHAYPLQSRLGAYATGYTKRIAIRRLLVPGEEWYEDEAAGWVPCSSACSGLKRAGAYGGGMGARVAEGRPQRRGIYPCPCEYARQRRVGLERRLGFFLSQVHGLPYRLTLAKVLRRGAHASAPSAEIHSVGSVPPPRAATTASPHRRHARTDARKSRNRSYSVVALGAMTAPTHSFPAATPADRALVAAVPVARDYYCSELLAAAFMRMGLLPSAEGGQSIAAQLGLGTAVTRASTYWPNAWCQGGVVDAALPDGYYLDDEVVIDCSMTPLKHALARPY